MSAAELAARLRAARDLGQPLDWVATGGAAEAEAEAEARLDPLSRVVQLAERVPRLEGGDGEEGGIVFPEPRVIAVRDPYNSPDVGTGPLLPVARPVCAPIEGRGLSQGAVFPVVQEVVLDHAEADEEETTRSINHAALHQLHRVRALHRRQVQDVEADMRRCQRARAEAEACEAAYASLRGNNELPERTSGSHIPEGEGAVELNRKDVGLRPLPTDLPMPQGTWAAGTHSQEAADYYRSLRRAVARRSTGGGPGDGSIAGRTRTRRATGASTAGGGQGSGGGSCSVDESVTGEQGVGASVASDGRGDLDPREGVLELLERVEPGDGPGLERGLPRLVAAAVRAARAAERETVLVERAVAELPPDSRRQLLEAEELAVLARAIADRLEATTPQHPGQQLSKRDSLVALWHSMPRTVGERAALKGQYAPPFVFLRVGAGDKADEIAASGAGGGHVPGERVGASGRGGRGGGRGDGEGGEARPPWEVLPALDPESHEGPLAVESAWGAEGVAEGGDAFDARAVCVQDVLAGEAKGTDDAPAPTARKTGTGAAGSTAEGGTASPGASGIGALERPGPEGLVPEGAAVRLAPAVTGRPEVVLDRRSGALRAPVAPSTPTLQHCINRLAHWERLGSDALWECSGCRKRVRAMKRLRPVVLPPLLVVNLVRFKFCEDGSMLKNGRKIDFPRVLNAEEAMRAAGVEGAAAAAAVLQGAGSLGPQGVGARAGPCSPVYDLAGVVCHLGSTISRGHYVAYVRSAVTGTWWECDDEWVGRVDGDREDEVAVREREDMAGYPGWQEVPLHARRHALDGWAVPAAEVAAEAGARLDEAAAEGGGGEAGSSGRRRSRSGARRRRSRGASLSSAGGVSPRGLPDSVRRDVRLREAAASAALEEEAVGERLGRLGSGAYLLFYRRRGTGGLAREQLQEWVRARLVEQMPELGLGQAAAAGRGEEEGYADTGAGGGASGDALDAGSGSDEGGGGKGGAAAGVTSRRRRTARRTGGS